MGSSALPLRWRLHRLRKRADDCASRGLQNEVLRLREMAARLATHAGARALSAHYLVLWGQSLFWHGETTPAQQAFQRAREGLQAGGAQEDEFQALLGLAQVAIRRGQLPDAGSHLDAAARLEPSAAQRIQLLKHRSELEYARGNLHNSRELLEQARQQARSSQDGAREGWLLHALAHIESECGNLGRALELIEQAEKHWAGRELLGRPQALRLRAKIERQRGQLGHAQAHYLSALQLFSALQHAAGIAAAQSGLASVALHAGRAKEAESLLDAATVQYERMEYRPRQAVMLLSRVELHLLNGNYAWARKRSEEALMLSRELGERRIEADAHWQLGEMERRSGAHDAARKHLLRSLTLYREIGSRAGEAMVLLSLARAHTQESESQSWLEQALVRFQESGSWEGYAQALLMQAETSRAGDRMDEARSSYQKAGQLFQRIESKAGLAQVELGLGDVERMEGEKPAAALAHYETAQRLMQQLEDRLGEAAVLRSRARLLQPSDPAAARAQFFAALERLREEDKTAMAHVLLGIGELDQQAGNYDSARLHLVRARDLYQQSGSRLGWAHAMRILGELELALARPDMARQHFEFAFTLYEPIRDAWGLSAIHLAMGRLELHQQRWEEAARHFQAALEIFRRLRHRRGQGHALLGLAACERELHQYETARAHALESRAHFQACADLEQEKQALRQMGDLEMAAGAVQQAMQYYNELRSLNSPPEGDRRL